uniref:(northern house mosquito) hypothetical protein n=1 Tax=Culex pipiens TaxID=7175 RepID=A0A8D8JHL3_CULPI
MWRCTGIWFIWLIWPIRSTIFRRCFRRRTFCSTAVVRRCTVCRRADRELRVGRCLGTNRAIPPILGSRRGLINSRRLPLLRKGLPRISSSSHHRRSSSKDLLGNLRLSRPQARPISRRRRISSNRPEVIVVELDLRKRVRHRRLRRLVKRRLIRGRPFQDSRVVPAFRLSRRRWHPRTRAIRRSAARTSSMDTIRAIRRRISRIKVNPVIHRTVHQTRPKVIRHKAIITEACHRPHPDRFRPRARPTPAQVLHKAPRVVPSRAAISKGHRTPQHHSPITVHLASILRSLPAVLRCRTPTQVTAALIPRTRTVNLRQVTHQPVANPAIHHRRSNNIQAPVIPRQANRTVLQPRRSRPAPQLHQPAHHQLKPPERQPTPTNPARPQDKPLPLARQPTLRPPARPTFLQPRQPDTPPVQAPPEPPRHHKHTHPPQPNPDNPIRPKAATRRHPKPVARPSPTPPLHPRPNTNNPRAVPLPTPNPAAAPPEPVPKANPDHPRDPAPSTRPTATTSKATRRFRRPRDSTSRVATPASTSGHRTPKCHHPDRRDRRRRARTATDTDSRRSKPNLFVFFRFLFTTLFKRTIPCNLTAVVCSL